MHYQQRAVRILGALLDDYTPDEVAEAVDQAYGHNRFSHPDVAPLRKIETGHYVLELFHGPTLAFKDMALQLLPHLLTLAARKQGETREVFILVATSGDTGKAALEGFADVPGTRCAVFYPHGGVSEAQRLQMVTQRGDNTHVIAVDGNFDDAQTGVKHLFTDPRFIDSMNARGRVLSSANSINYGRLIPQVAYYFSAYADLLSQGAIALGDPVHFVVPTGNFGNILAADYARRMGLPVGKLLCASNSNCILTDFLTTGVYDANRAFHKTISPSMDILISSNLERYLYELAHRRDGQVAAWMAQLQAQRRYALSPEQTKALQARMRGAWFDDAQTLQTIRETWNRSRYSLDPHSAIAQAMLAQYRQDTGDATPAVVVSTASPFKFGGDVAKALFPDSTEAWDDFACCDRLAELTGLPVPGPIASLPTLPIRHSKRCAPDRMGDALVEVIP